MHTAICVCINFELICNSYYLHVLFVDDAIHVTGRYNPEGTLAALAAASLYCPEISVHTIENLDIYCALSTQDNLCGTSN